jgi:L-ascorbate metabolism protein UlaG (beta-lactamase superfamily)
MPPAVQADALGKVDLVLVTHHHTDHMDAQTLQPLLRAAPQSRLVAPAASTALALERGAVESNRLLPMDAGETIEPFPQLRITATPAAHETRDLDENGRHRFLGYLVESDNDCRIWHSGDCVPFEGLAETMAALSPTVALLPVNGRKKELSAQGIAGNFSVEEAIALARATGAQAMIAHHYGMFAFNTARPEDIDRAADTAPLTVMRAELGTCYACG